MDELLNRFSADPHTKEALKVFFAQFIAEEAVKRVYAGAPVDAVKDAHDLINGAFEALEDKYGLKERPAETITSPR